MLGTIWRETTSEKSVDANTDSPFKDLQMLKFPDNCLFQTAKYMYLYKIGLKCLFIYIIYFLFFFFFVLFILTMFR